MTEQAIETATDDETVVALNTRVPRSVRVFKGQLDEDPASPQSIVLHGRLDPNTLRFLNVDSDYQRPLGNRLDIYDALKNGTVVPNVDIGVRGMNYDSDGETFIITDPAYIIDGWQRIGTAMQLLENIPDHPIRIFATIHFGTDSIWERHRFTELNKNIKKVSSNLHLRNMRDTNEAILTLYGLSNNTKGFPLYKKVCWSQNMHRGELITAMVFLKSSRALHQHLAFGSNTVAGIAETALRAANKIRLAKFRANVATYYEVIDDCWGIRTIDFRHAAPQIKAGFLETFARVLSEHLDFWSADGSTLFVGADLRRKLKSYPLRDPQVMHLAGSGGAARNLLRQTIINHLNKGRRTGHLVSRFDRHGGGAA